MFCNATEDHTVITDFENNYLFASYNGLHIFLCSDDDDATTAFVWVADDADPLNGGLIGAVECDECAAFTHMLPARFTKTDVENILRSLGCHIED